MRDVLTLAELTFREARRSKILWTALALGLAFIALYTIGFYFIYREMEGSYGSRNIALDAGFNFVVMAGLYVVSFLGVMLAVLTSVGTIAGEVTSHTVQAVATKPLRRASIVLGKWLGLSLMLTTYIVLLAGGIVLSTWAISGYLIPHAVPGTLLIAFQALIMLSVSLVGGTRLSTVANGVVAFMLYGIAFVGGWIEQVGSFAYNDTAVDIGIISSLLVPSEAMWKAAAYIMQPPATRALGISPFTVSGAPSTAMLVYAAIYTVALVGVAVHSFNTRDL
jgi:ABC-type transport system involved in multi-copper enzyme maturation permease subunit